MSHGARPRGWGLSMVRSHALRNALIPTITVIGLTFASLSPGLS